MTIIARLRRIFLRDLGRYLYKSYYLNTKRMDTIEISFDGNVDKLELLERATEEYKFFDHITEDAMELFIKNYGDLDD